MTKQMPVRRPRLFQLVVLSLSMLVLLSCGGGKPEASNGPFGVTAAGRTDQLIVKPLGAGLATAYEGRAAEFAARWSTAAGIELSPVRQTHNGAHVLALPAAMEAGEVAALASRLQRRADVAYAEPDLVLQGTAVPNDAAFGKLWGLREPAVAAGGINAVDAWDVSTGDPSLVVAVVDSGVLPHAELSGRLLAGYDFVSNVPSANDGNARDADAADPGDWLTNSEAAQLGRTARASSWHGTHVAGTIGAAGNNGSGVAGVNWRSRILPIRVLGKAGGYSSDIADGIAWAAGAAIAGVPGNATPARVINLSLGGTGSCSETTRSAINFALGQSAVVVVAAGNSAVDVSTTNPANCPGVIAVAAVGLNGQRAAYSNYGTGVTVAAPGGDPGHDSGVLSLGDSGQTTPTRDDSLLAEYGTSMAAPHVSGVVSLMLSVNPALTPADVKAILLGTARAFPTGTLWDCTTATCGAGIVNAGSAVRAAANTNAVVTSAVPQSGVWWNPAENGRGFVIEVQDGTLSLGAYLYDSSGRASWYLSSGAMQSASQYTGTLAAYSGGQTLLGAYKAPTGSSVAGTVSISFDSQTTATLTWPGGTVPIQRLRFATGTVQPGVFAPEAGVWWSADEAGRGYAFEAQNGIFSMAAFMYDAQGSPIWYLAAGPLSASNTFTGTLVEYANGQPLVGAYRAPVPKNTLVGTVSVRFLDAVSADMTLPDGRVIRVQKFRAGSAAPGITVPANQVLTAKLVGIWAITYQIVTTWTDYFLFNEVRESPIEPGVYNVWGINQYDSLAVGGWDPTLGRYTIYAPGPLFAEFYVFDLSGANAATGCYYMVESNPTRFSDCYALAGTKIAEIAPLGLSSLPRPAGVDANSRSAALARENALVADQRRAGARQTVKSAAAASSATAPASEIDNLARAFERRRAQAR